MNRWINNELKRLHGWRDSSNDKGRTHRRTFLMEVLERPFSIDHLNPNNATCIICQYSLYPIEGEPWPTEDPVKLPCGHFIGQSCAKQWFSSLVKGKHHVDEDFNTGCPLCRHQIYEVEDTQELKDDNRARWTALAKIFREQVIKYRAEWTHEVTMRNIESQGGFKQILERLDHIALMRWYIFRHFEHNLRKNLNIHLIKTWILRTKTGRPSRDWMMELHHRWPEAAKELDKKLCKAYQVSEPGTHTDHYNDEPEHRILRTYTHVDMLPSRIWNRIVGAYTGLDWFSVFELEKIKLELLDTVTWSIRQGEPQEDFPNGSFTHG